MALWDTVSLSGIPSNTARAACAPEQQRAYMARRQLLTKTVGANPETIILAWDWCRGRGPSSAGRCGRRLCGLGLFGWRRRGTWRGLVAWRGSFWGGSGEEENSPSDSPFPPLIDVRTVRLPHRPLSLSSESQTCLTVYREGGAPAVFRSANCPRWTLSSSSSGGGSRRPVTEDCQVALLLGRRRSQEDRAVCALDIRIPFIGRTGVKEVSVGIAADFDGHNGDEASEMASKLLLESSSDY
ncbi:putative protein phosphatase 2C 76 [Acorus calamus]|uniref:protein-serine/threonine phosphatase n=1 Tax=Acorus calamus TaxID=4465 RepID=A0AAV9CIT9_ACOCL|nr:putative protein phosphatase 2C 76 [Acorus calamus]